MTPDEAAALCADLEWVERPGGSIACKHRLDIAIGSSEKSEMCHHGSHFVCELVLHKLRKKAEEERAAEHSLSFTRVDRLTSCPRRYAFDYEYGLKGKTRPGTALRSGDAFGIGRAKIDSGIPWEPAMVSKKLTVVERSKVKASLRFYRTHPPYAPESGTCEDMHTFQFEGFHWVAYTDWLSHGRTRIVEWKYAGKTYDFLRIVRQASIYFMAVPEARTFELIRFAKPAHKLKTKEKWDAYERRVFEGLSKKGPTEVYDRLVIERRSYRPQNVVAQMAAQARMADALRKKNFPPAYGEQCIYCPYHKACRALVHHGTDIVANQIKYGEVKLK